MQTTAEKEEDFLRIFKPYQTRLINKALSKLVPIMVFTGSSKATLAHFYANGNIPKTIEEIMEATLVEVEIENRRLCEA